MKAAQIDGYGGKEVVKVREVPKPAAPAGKLVVEIHAAGVNPFDWKIREGYAKPKSLPATLGGDFSGVVSEVGAGVSGFKKGDEVFGTAIVLSGGSGSFAEYAVVDPKRIALKPKKTGHVETAALPLASVSAYQALVEHMNLEEGEKVLIHGGAGGIGSSAIQIAKSLGAHVAATASAKDLDFVKKLGAEEAIDYRKQSFEEELENYDAVYDTVGGETYEKSFRVLKKGGRIVSMLEQPRDGLAEKFEVKAVGQMTHIDSGKLKKIAELVDRGELEVQVDKTFRLDEAAEALEFQKTGHPRGKVVIKVR